MPPLFNIIRTCVLATVCVFTIIVLSLAAHFLNVLESSDQTNYVPLAIFTATATLFIMSALWIGSCARKPHPIFQTKYELAWLAGLGILWLSLGAYTVSLDEVEVECFDDNGVEVDSLDGFSTDVYHAQYHAIQAFSILNAILLLGLFLLLLFLAIRRNRADPRRPVWAIPATMVNWFGQGRRGPRHEKSDSHTPLPPPITARFTIARRAELAKGDDDDDDVTKSKPKLDMKEKFVSAAPMLARTFNFGRGDRDRDRSSDEEEGRGRDRRRDRERSQERDRERQRERQLAEKLERDRERDRNRERELAQVYDRELERERERARERERQRDRSRERERAREREQELDRPPSRTPQRSGTIPPRSATTAGNVVGRNWQAPQRTLTIPPRGPPRDAPTTSRPTADVQAPPAARTRQTPGRSRTIPARNLPTTNTTRQPAAPTPIADAFKSSRDRDLPSPPPADPPTSRSAPLRSTTRDRAAPPATSSRTRTGATTGATPTTQPAPRRSGR